MDHHTSWAFDGDEPRLDVDFNCGLLSTLRMLRVQNLNFNAQIEEGLTIFWDCQSLRRVYVPHLGCVSTCVAGLPTGFEVNAHKESSVGAASLRAAFPFLVSFSGSINGSRFLCISPAYLTTMFSPHCHDEVIHSALSRLEEQRLDFPISIPYEQLPGYLCR